MRTATICETASYGQPVGSGSAPPADGRIEMRSSPRSMTPNSSRAASRAPSTVSRCCTSAARSSLASVSTFSSCCLTSISSCWRIHACTGSTNSAASRAPTTATPSRPSTQRLLRLVTNRCSLCTPRVRSSSAMRSRRDWGSSLWRDEARRPCGRRDRPTGEAALPGRAIALVLWLPLITPVSQVSSRQGWHPRPEARDS